MEIIQQFNIYRMLSKQDKLKYGEQLRRQMKEKQEKKRTDDMQKRGGIRKSPTDTRIQVQPQPYIDNKQTLQNRFEGQNIDYYGRPGGGAPNRPNNEQNYGNIQPQHPDYQQNQYGRMKTNQDATYYMKANMPDQNYYGMKMRQQPPQFDNYPKDNQQQYGRMQQPQYQPQQPVYDPSTNYVQQQLQSYNNNAPFAPPSYTNQNIPVGYPPQAMMQRVPTDRSFVQQHQVQPAYEAKYGQQAYQQSMNYNNNNNIGAYQGQPHELYQEPIQQISQKHQAYRQKTLQNQQLMQIHKKGGRNLLKLQNMTIDQQQIKQKQKQQMRKQLQLQMKEAQQRKKQQQQRIKRQQIEQHRKNQQYLLQQKMRLQEEERKKNDKQRQLLQQNAKNLQQRRRLQQQAKQKALRQKMKQSNPPAIVSHPASPRNNNNKNKQVFSKQAQFQANIDETTSQVSSSTVMEKGFNTGVSKQFYENERRRDQQKYFREKNLQAVTEQIKRLKQHIDKQNDFFKREIQKVKLESEMAEHEKKKAQQQIQNLKFQLQKKSQDDNQRLFMALQRQSVLVKQQQEKHSHHNRQQSQNNYQPRQNVESLKPTRQQKLTKKQYEVPQEVSRKPQYNPKLAQSNISDDGSMLVSLHGDSKKIPINLPDDKLSMSRLSDFARETSFFKNQGKSPYLGQGQKKNFQAHDSIAEEDEDRAQSRVAPRKQSVHKPVQKDELDKLVESRQKSRDGQNWGQMSSVNSDITKQIEELLKKKDNPYRPPSSTKYDNNYKGQNLFQQSIVDDRPNSRLSNAGKRALNSRGGLQYQGASIGTIGSIAGNGTLGTVDIDKIQNRNDRRLAELKNLGVQTINTNNEDQFSKLDLILNKYKQSRVM